jgi:hypothetical protein
MVVRYLERAFPVIQHPKGFDVVPFRSTNAKEAALPGGLQSRSDAGDDPHRPM